MYTIYWQFVKNDLNPAKIFQVVHVNPPPQLANYTQNAKKKSKTNLQRHENRNGVIRKLHSM